MVEKSIHPLSCGDARRSYAADSKTRFLAPSKEYSKKKLKNYNLSFTPQGKQDEIRAHPDLGSSTSSDHQPSFPISTLPSSLVSPVGYNKQTEISDPRADHRNEEVSSRGVGEISRALKEFQQNFLSIHLSFKKYPRNKGCSSYSKMTRKTLPLYVMNQ